MCKVKKTYPLWGFLLSFPLWTVSCVDNKYDLDKDIDMTVNVGGEHLTIPAGSSDTAYLSKIRRRGYSSTRCCNPCVSSDEKG